VSYNFVYDILTLKVSYLNIEPFYLHADYASYLFSYLMYAFIELAFYMNFFNTTPAFLPILVGYTGIDLNHTF
jgi:hypothetical protein